MKPFDPAIAAPRPRNRTGMRVVIVGAGFSGTLLAVNLLDQPGIEVVLIDRDRERMGAGVAYSTSDASHYLNVRAANMSAFSDRPNDFVDWLKERETPSGTEFVTRATYGRYLRDTLARAMERHGSRIKLVDDEVLDVDERNDGVCIGLMSGGLIEADRAVLAIGNLPPHDPPGVDRHKLPSWRYISDPWAVPFEAGLEGDDRVLVLGTGLTAIDVILRLAASSFDGKIIAQSRRGLRPHRHVEGLPSPRPALARPNSEVSHLLAWVRAQTAERNWRLVIDSLRPITQTLWGAADADKRARFLRHLRPFWDIHRHRLAPHVADRIDTLVAEGRLEFRAGKVASVTVASDALHVASRARGADATCVEPFERVINCTGPQGDLLRSSDQLVRRMLAHGRIRPDALRLGLDIDRNGYVISDTGSASPAILAIGPMTRGDLWEVVAVPDIRNQVSGMAQRLVSAQRVRDRQTME